ncbi:hypothetical protein [Agromyces mariniharenae]|uniref:Uncharacterized protein n=1 Tax=Agromyces mariniharenae TaxID=2604423 RepID=A0A5S4V452_9MICO|nr:hypothetical protein [Agromyces mariniharenae]TYL53782.1 hypothetical protein FYC51_09115 [Agromyces mariniharenae]
MSDEWMLDIELRELRRAIELILRHIEATNGPRLAIAAEEFWSVTAPAIYDVSTTPELTIGQLSESWENLRDERDGNDDDTISYAAVWLGDLLKAIGHHAAP